MHFGLDRFNGAVYSTDRDQGQVRTRKTMNVNIEVIEVLFNNHSFIVYLFIYLFIYFLWHFSGTHVRTCVQVATTLNRKRIRFS